MDRRQRILVFGLAAVVIIGVIVTAFSLGNHSSSKPPATQISLTDHTTDGSEVRLTIEGPVNANELHSSSIISVSRDGRAIEVDRTYNNMPVSSATYLNNQLAFDDFMQALQNAGFTAQAKHATQQDETGQCPLGQRYIYELVTNDAIAMRTWSSSCRATTEPFGGNAMLVQQLFRAQIPDYAKVQAAALK
jgi:hypothetical protein